ncbi:helix-turn-helix transcriptional regulator [Hyphococcus sp.]|uniref:helix-turn-helix transcriptional regulator n=1 Tax=Hyphococcus sp. TaxID=2038636 RepID=UPI003D09B5F4
MDEASIRDLILEIYDTALEPDRWPGVLTRISDAMNANGAFIFELSERNDRRRIAAPYFSDTYTQDAVDYYLATHNDQEIADQDTFARHSRATDGIDLIGDDVLAESEEELLARANTQQLLEFGIRYRAGALLNKSDVNVDRFAIQFSADHGPITQAERQTMSIILPHVAKALSINRPTIQLASRYENVIQSLDMLRVGICIVLPYGDVIYKNQEFDRQIDKFGVFRVNHDGRLAFAAEECESGVGAYMRDLFVHGRFGARPWKEAIVSASSNDDRCLCLEVSPLSRQNDIIGRNKGAHLIYSLDTTQPFSIDTPAIAKRYELTAAEESILDLLAEGATNAEIAARRERSIETVNSQVKSILGKTGTHSRAKLIRLATNMSFGMLHSEAAQKLGFLYAERDADVPRIGDGVKHELT